MDRPYKKKSLGQHFLRNQSVVDHMIDAVSIDEQTNVMEIGCGDGFLTSAILEQTNCNKLIVFEIDHEWASYVRSKISDQRLEINIENILDTDWTDLYKHKKWVMLANLPYQITFPIFFMFVKNRTFFQEGIVMVQEEVAQKIVATRGKKLSKVTLFLQHHFEFKLLDRIDQDSFDPPPKVLSRLIYFKPKKELVPIPDEDNFWKFVKLCFAFPRQTLRNNLKQTHFEWEKLEPEILVKRAQQMTFDDFLTLWSRLKK